MTVNVVIFDHELFIPRLNSYPKLNFSQKKVSSKKLVFLELTDN